MRYRPAAIIAAAALALGGAVLIAAPAQAHDHGFVAQCDYASLDLTNYPAGSHVTGTVDGQTVLDQGFDGQYHSGRYALDGTKGHTVTVAVTSPDDPTGSHGWTFTASADTTACVKPDQPAPRVAEASSETQDCTSDVVTVHHSTDTYGTVYDRPSNTWVEQAPVHADLPDTTRPKTDAEAAACIPPKQDEPPTTTTHDTPVRPAAALDANAGTELAHTGPMNPTMPLLIAGGLLAAGAAALTIAARRRHATR